MHDLELGDLGQVPPLLSKPVASSVKERAGLNDLQGPQSLQKICCYSCLKRRHLEENMCFVFNHKD